MAALLVLSPVGVSAASSPSQWPDEPGVAPSLTATPHTIRFAGPDRFGTNAALGLALRGAGDFPFDTSDRTSGNAPDLAHADDWWGAGSCPRSIILIADDSAADALAADSLSDPTDKANQPRLQRVAASDPIFDPIGGFDRPDTGFAPVVVTASARSGATALSRSARVTAADVATGGCTTAREAIIVGGPTTVPVGAEAELLTLGYREVFRIAGTDRYDTAARVAAALGTTAPAPGATCVDPNAADGDTRQGWYGNAVVEYRDGPTNCGLLSRSVVLADGGTGADALAAGWWTSYWQVPVLLVAPDGSLPAPTRAALQSLAIDTIIVLGGIQRIPEATLDEARRLAHATVGRISGVDRYATSVETAKAFGGWYPTGQGADFDDDVLCLAGSGGPNASAAGSPDVVAAGPLCGRIGASHLGSPMRALPPVTGADAATASTGRRRPSHDAVPVLLTPVGGDLAGSVASFVGAAFTPDARWCSVDDASTGCLGPGFGVVVGGEGVVTPAAVNALTDLLSGGHAGDVGDRAPALGPTFATALDMAPIFSPLGGGGGVSLCAPRAALGDVRWLSITADAERRHFLAETDVLRGQVYRTGSAENRPSCLGLPGGLTSGFLAGVSLSGVSTPAVPLHIDPSRHLTLSAPIQSAGTRSDLSTGSHISAAGPSGQVIQRGGLFELLIAATLDLDLRVQPSGSAGWFSATYTLTTSLGALTGTASGEFLLVDNRLELRGSSQTGPFAEGDAAGGFRASVPPTDSAPVVRWDLDGF